MNKKTMNESAGERILDGYELWSIIKLNMCQALFKYI